MILCYICEGYGTLQDGRICPQCQGTGEDKETERIWQEVRKQGADEAWN